jgi:hypothetical protein
MRDLVEPPPPGGRIGLEGDRNKGTCFLAARGVNAATEERLGVDDFPGLATSAIVAEALESSGILFLLRFQ